VRLNRVLDYVEASLATKLRVAELAGLSEMSPYYFGKLFKQSTGLTVHEYVTRRRVQRATDLLKPDGVEISGVGAAIGIPDQSQFTRLFHKHTGIPPDATGQDLPAEFRSICTKRGKLSARPAPKAPILGFD